MDEAKATGPVRADAGIGDLRVVLCGLGAAADEDCRSSDGFARAISDL
jgi:hypothetical protein